ncbi:MAG: TfoX/Sxy family protein [Eggerthellaceae bacterium]|nr:TfoX/Sxy family protein [Eggerthellaceae bacterium]
MASSIEYLEFVLDLLQDVPAVTHKKMMGEYLLYSGGILFGGVYDDRFLLKDTPAARKAFLQLELPYVGAKPMVLVDIEDTAAIAEVIAAMLPELPSPKKR